MLKIETNKPEIFPDLIDRIWIAEISEEAVELRVPPNPYVNLIIPLDNASYKYESWVVDTPQIEGASSKSTSFIYPPGTRLIGVRFFPYGIYPFIPLRGKQIVNSSVSCPLHTEALKRITKIRKSDPDEVILNSVYDLLGELFNQKLYDLMEPVKEFYNTFRWNEGVISLEAYCKKAGTNYTTFNRRFTHIVGISPKKFERLIKFRKSLCSLIDSSEKLTSIGAEAGYYDQAHFIREFKMFLNYTPSEYQSFIKLADKESKIINYNFRLF